MGSRGVFADPSRITSLGTPKYKVHKDTLKICNHQSYDNLKKCT